MPSKSKAQHKLMVIAAHTPGGYGGVPQSVGQEFAAADAGQHRTHTRRLHAKGRAHGAKHGG